MRSKITLVAALASLVSVVATAADANSAGAAREFGPGQQFGVTQQRQVVITGLLDFDVINRGQYLHADSNVGDHYGTGNIRALFGTSVKLDERTKVVIKFAYEAEAGDNTADDKTGTKRSGFAVVDQAYAKFADFLGFESFGLMVGRMPFAWNLRSEEDAHPSFLYDPAANHPRVTGWDGAQAAWNISEGIDLVPFAYNVPGAGTLLGFGGNWKPARSGDSRTFITGLVTYENKVPNRSVDPLSKDSTIDLVDGVAGKKLITYTGGFETQLGDLSLYAEGALQNGDQTDTIKYSGVGGYAGMDWHAYAAQSLVFGAQIDHLSGTGGGKVAPGGTNNALVNNWEGVSDTLIVEHEQYGELSRLLSGDQSYGLQDLKLKVGVAFDDRNKVRLNAIYAFYRTAEATRQGGRKFGQEGDLSLSWDYTYNTTIKLFSGGFLPGQAYVDVSNDTFKTQPASKDLIYCMGVNLSVVF